MIDSKKYLLEILDYYKYKINNNFTTMAELNSVVKILDENMQINGTISDFAKFYDKPENQVRATISRNLIDKPKRTVLYPFHKFAKVIPENWRKK